MEEKENSKISIEQINASNWRESLLLSVLPEQMKFVADYAPIAMLGLAKTSVHDEGFVWEPFGIRMGSQLVGFFMLAKNLVRLSYGCFTSSLIHDFKDEDLGLRHWDVFVKIFAQPDRIL